MRAMIARPHDSDASGQSALLMVKAAVSGCAIKACSGDGAAMPGRDEAITYVHRSDQARGRLAQSLGGMSVRDDLSDVLDRGIKEAMLEDASPCRLKPTR